MMKNHNPLLVKKTWRVLKKHEQFIPLTGLTFDLSSSQTRSALFVKQNRKLEKDFVFVNFLWPGKPGFPQKIPVYIVPANWFSQLNCLFSFIYIYIYFKFLFYSFCFIY